MKLPPTTTTKIPRMMLIKGCGINLTLSLILIYSCTNHSYDAITLNTLISMFVYTHSFHHFSLTFWIKVLLFFFNIYFSTSFLYMEMELLFSFIIIFNGTKEHKQAKKLKKRLWCGVVVSRKVYHSVTFTYDI